jgi:chromosome segregation ATPase
MDQALIAVLKEMFHEHSEQIRGDFSTLRQEIDQNFQSQAAQFDQRLHDQAAQIDQRFQDNAAQIDQRFQDQAAQIDQRFQDQAAQIDQRFQDQAAQIFSLRDSVGQLEKKVDGIDERLHQTQIIVESLPGQMRLLAEGITANREVLESFKSEFAVEFSKVWSFFSYHIEDLDSRTRELEETTIRHQEEIAALRVTRKKRPKPS